MGLPYPVPKPRHALSSVATISLLRVLSIHWWLSYQVTHGIPLPVTSIWLISNSYFMPVMLANAGITNSHEQLLMNAINVILSMLSAIAGSFFVDRLGRRTLLIWATALTGIIYIPINVLASFSAHEINTGMGYGFIACIFIYGIFYSFGWTPLQALYPPEILPNRVRAKGMAFQGLVSSAASFINLYATPIALQNIGWKSYTIFCEAPVSLL